MYRRRVGVAVINNPVELLKAGQGLGGVLLALQLSVVGSNAVEGLEADVVGEDLVQHTHRVDVVVKVPSRLLMVKLIQVSFSRMSEGRMADVVSQGDGFNEIQVQMKGGADGAGDAGYQLHVEGAAGNVVIFAQRKDLGLVGVAVVIGAVHDLVDVVHKGRPPHRGVILGQVAATDHLFIGK